MRVITTVAVLCLATTACGEPASKSGADNSSTNQNNTSSNNTSSNNTSSNNASSNNASTNNASSNNASTNNASTNNAMTGGPGDPCEDGSGCQDGLRCQSAEERAWNFCGAPMEPECAEAEVGDSCGNCFSACSEDADCDGQTCNGTYCIGPRTCAEEQQPPP